MAKFTGSLDRTGYSTPSYHFFDGVLPPRSGAVPLWSLLPEHLTAFGHSKTDPDFVHFWLEK
jgi:hypothetical protein